jgi:hypothetical protein
MEQLPLVPPVPEPPRFFVAQRTACRGALAVVDTRVERLAREVCAAWNTTGEK